MELSQNGILSILSFKKGINDRVLVKGNYVDSGLNLGAETLSWLLIIRAIHG